MKRVFFLLFLVPTGLAACEDQQITRAERPPIVDASPLQEPSDDAPDAGLDSAPDGDARPPSGPDCTSSFGAAITPDFGRLDGTVRTVIVPGTPSCKSDSDHVIVQVDVVEGATTVTYPVVVNIYSDLAKTDPAVRLGQTTHELVGPSWSTGWHTSLSLDYAASLGMHSSGGFLPRSKAELGAAITTAFPKGTKVSAYMFGFDTFDGGHKVHRNASYRDGALVSLATPTPTWLLFHFSEQIF